MQLIKHADFRTKNEHSKIPCLSQTYLTSIEPTGGLFMKRLQVSLNVLTLFVCVVLSSCGTTGQTSRFVLLLDLPSNMKVATNIHVASTAMDADAAYLNALKVKPWGKFGVDDLSNIEQSLRDTIKQHLAATIHSTESRIDLHLVIRRYVVSTSNTAAAVMACVTWAAATPTGSLIYEDQFYASDAGYLVTTIGIIKDSVNKAIVRRIAIMSLAIAQDPTASPQPTKVDKTSSSFEEAVSHLPKSMVSMGDPFIVFFPLTYTVNAFGLPVQTAISSIKGVGLLTPKNQSKIDWKVADRSESFDWSGYLNKLYSP